VLGATPVTAAMQQQTISFFAPLTGGIMSHLAVAVDSVFIFFLKLIPTIQGFKLPIKNMNTEINYKKKV
jgi:hypothetical protein